MLAASPTAAVVARAADTPLRAALPGAPPRYAGSSLARLVSPGAVPMAVDLVFSGMPSPRAAAARRATVLPTLAEASQTGVYEYTYILDGRGMVRGR